LIDEVDKMSKPTEVDEEKPTKFWKKSHKEDMKDAAAHKYDYGFVCETTNFSTLHWLAYNNDYLSVKIILSHIGCEKLKKSIIMKRSFITVGGKK
jgi:hypothetical protein